MTETAQSAGQPFTPETKKRPEMLNVLTILTFIGSAWGIISAIYGYFSAEKSFAKMQDLQSKDDSASNLAKSLLGPDALEMARKALEHRLPITLLGVVGCALCLYGALQMRSLKKMGFSIYLVGELLPIIASAVFIGFATFGGLTLVLSLLFPVVFIILYATQLKHLG